MAEYREAIRLDPDLIDAHNGLAVTLANQGKLEEAVAEFREIIRVDPTRRSATTTSPTRWPTWIATSSPPPRCARYPHQPNHYNARFNLGELFRLEAKYHVRPGNSANTCAWRRTLLRISRNIRRGKEVIEKFEDP